MFLLYFIETRMSRDYSPNVVASRFVFYTSFSNLATIFNVFKMLFFNIIFMMIALSSSTMR